MAHWGKKEPEFDAIAALLERYPGLSARELARQLQVAPSTVTRVLPSMEEAGVLLSEDRQGRLRPFGRKK